MEINNYLETNLNFATNLEVNNNWSRFDYNNQPFQCGKNAEGFWLMASCKEKDTPACFECDSELYDDGNEERLEEMWHEQSKINQHLEELFPNLRLIEQDNFFKLCITYPEEAFPIANFEYDCQIIIGASKNEIIRRFRSDFESQY
ncbi:MAG: hypothetical protein FGM14_13625 [Flavobacteriales bacterium]|nr:hypothetical protein [Flavobacteriales bacterium]